MFIYLGFKPLSLEETEEYVEFSVRALSADTEIETKSGKVVFPTEVLSASAESLSGCPVILDHKWEVDKVVGVVVKSWFDPKEKALFARVRVTKTGNEKLISLIKLEPSPVKSVSIGASVTRRDGVVQSIDFKELSLVLYGADPNAQILSRYEDEEVTLSEAQWWDDPELRAKAPRDYFLDPSSRRYPYKTWDGKISCERLKAAMSLASLHGHRQIYDRAKALYEKNCKKEG